MKPGTMEPVERLVREFKSKAEAEQSLELREELVRAGPDSKLPEHAAYLTRASRAELNLIEFLYEMTPSPPDQPMVMHIVIGRPLPDGSFGIEEEWEPEQPFRRQAK